MGRLIAPLGMITYVTLFLTVVTGYAIMKFNIPWLKLSWHIALGVTTLVLGTTHFVIVIMTEM